MTDRLGLLWQIRERTDKDVDEDLKVVCVEVLGRPWRREQEVEDLENEELQAEVLGRVLCEGEGPAKSACCGSRHQRMHQHAPARLSMKIMFSPNVLLAPSRRMRTTSTLF